MVALHKQQHNVATNVLTEAACLCQNIGRPIVVLLVANRPFVLKRQHSLMYKWRAPGVGTESPVDAMDYERRENLLVAMAWLLAVLGPAPPLH
jgi:hypothetical protein